MIFSHAIRSVLVLFVFSVLSSAVGAKEASVFVTIHKTGAAKTKRYFGKLVFCPENPMEAVLTLGPESLAKKAPEFLKQPVLLSHAGVSQAADYFANPLGWIQASKERDRDGGFDDFGSSGYSYADPREPVSPKFSVVSPLGKYDPQSVSFSFGANDTPAPVEGRKDDFQLQFDGDGNLLALRPVVTTNSIAGYANPVEVADAVAAQWDHREPKAEAKPLEFFTDTLWTGSAQPNFLNGEIFRLSEIGQRYPEMGALPYCTVKFSAPKYVDERHLGFDGPSLEIPLRPIGHAKNGRIPVLIESDVEQAILQLRRMPNAPPPVTLARQQRFPASVLAAIQQVVPHAPLGIPKQTLVVYEVDERMVRFVKPEMFHRVSDKFRGKYFAYDRKQLVIVARPKTKPVTAPVESAPAPETEPEPEPESESEYDYVVEDFYDGLITYAMMYLETHTRVRAFSLTDLLKLGTFDSDRAIECGSFVAGQADTPPGAELTGSQP